MSTLLKWAWSGIEYIGLVKKERRILLMGLDNSGKTTLLHMLKLLFNVDGPKGQFIIPFNDFMNLSFVTHDAGGHMEYRHQIFGFYADILSLVDGVIFMIDATDERRYEEARNSLMNIFKFTKDITKPVLILANKMDKMDVVPHVFIEQFMDKMNLNHYTNNIDIDRKGSICCKFHYLENVERQKILREMKLPNVKLIVIGYVRNIFVATEESDAIIIPMEINVLCAKYVGVIFDKSFYDKYHHNVHVALCSVVNRTGFMKGLEWMVGQLV